MYSVFYSHVCMDTQLWVIKTLIVMPHRHTGLGYQAFAIIKTCIEVGVLPSDCMHAYNAQGCVFSPQSYEIQKLKVNNTKQNINKQTNKVVEWKHESSRVSVWISG